MKNRIAICVAVGVIGLCGCGNIRAIENGRENVEVVNIGELSTVDLTDAEKEEKYNAYLLETLQEQLEGMDEIEEAIVLKDEAGLVIIQLVLSEDVLEENKESLEKQVSKAVVTFLELEEDNLKIEMQ